MAEETGTATPASSGEGASASPASTGAEGAVAGQSGQASAAAGNAPGGGGDAGSAGEATGATSAAVSAAQFAFLKRNFRDQKHAEEVLGSEVGMTRGLQRQNAELERKFAAAEAELNALRGIVAERQPQARGQEARGGQEAPGGPSSFPQSLIDSGELNFIAKMFTNPDIGPAGAVFRMAELFEKHNEDRISKLEERFSGEITSRDQQAQQHAALARTMTASQSLVAEYPELDANNQSEEAEKAQQAILEIIKNLPGGPQWLAKDPKKCFKWAVGEYRETYGTPIFAQPPGTSGSPSSRAAAAAEAASTTAAALDGSGVPRQRTNGQPEGAVERMKRENREIKSRMATTPSGRPLGFEIPGA